ncbi:MAG: FIST C-terminal domain-containing protein [Myxococcota bacterium]
MHPEELTRFLLTYEAGLRTGDEIRVRAPFKRERNGALGFACGIPVGTEICVTESSPDAQVASALEAARLAKAALNGTQVSGALVFDCICRALILGNRFDEAVKGISDELGQVPIAGFETYGEIGGKGFHNTSTVVLAFGATP